MRIRRVYGMSTCIHADARAKKKGARPRVLWNMVNESESPPQRARITETLVIKRISEVLRDKLYRSRARGYVVLRVSPRIIALLLLL